jgi:hypothetical protein
MRITAQALQALFINEIIIRQHAQTMADGQAELFVLHAVGGVELGRDGSEEGSCTFILAAGGNDGLLVRTAGFE